MSGAQRKTLMADGGVDLAAKARAKAYATPLDEFQVHDIEHFTSDTLWPWFERLRAEDPVHYTADSEYGPYWSLTRYADIVAADGDNHRLSSSSVHGGITLFMPPEDATPEAFSEERTSFISMDPPRHDDQRRAVSPIFSTPALAELEPLIRSRAATILDELPIGETFDFVDKVADRADQPDAGDPVRLPVRGAPHAAAVLRHAALRPGRTLEEQMAAPGGDVRDPRQVRAAVERPRAATRPAAT